MNCQKYWATVLQKDMENWILYEKPWLQYWNNIKNPEYEVDLITIYNKGFILIKKYTTDSYVKDCNIHIHFAYVYSDFRRLGVLKQLVNKLKTKYINESISLFSCDDITDNVWEYFGFICDKKEKAGFCNEYYILRKR